VVIEQIKVFVVLIDVDFSVKPFEMKNNWTWATHGDRNTRCL